MTFQEKLSLLSKMRGFTQQKMAAAIGCSRITINRFYAGHTEVRATDLLAILRTLNIDVDSQLDRALEEQMKGNMPCDLKTTN